MPESPLVPDGSTPGTQFPASSEQPLTRRERREREAAAAAAAAAETARSERSAEPSAPEAPVEPVAPTTAVIAVVESRAGSAEPAAAPAFAPVPQQVVVVDTGVPTSRRERRASEAPGRRARDTTAPRGEASGRRAATSDDSSRIEPVVAPRRGGRRALRAVVAMGFAATLALATSVPALSLLTPSDVQALTLATETAAPGAPGQRVEVDGDVIASPTVEREGYQHQTIEEYARAAGIRAEPTFTNNPSGTIQWPFAVGVHIGDEFGPRNCEGCSSDHGGQDFNPGLGAEIQAIADGVVSNSTDAGGSLGVVMMIDHVIHGETVTSVYAHMQFGSRRFEKGDTVKVGDVIGTTGSTGMSTGPHLHFEIRIGGINGTKVNPLDWLYAHAN